MTISLEALRELEAFMASAPISPETGIPVSIIAINSRVAVLATADGGQLVLPVIEQDRNSDLGANSIGWIAPDTLVDLHALWGRP
jgi:hypothetical protein